MYKLVDFRSEIQIEVFKYFPYPLSVEYVENKKNRALYRVRVFLNHVLIISLNLRFTARRTHKHDITMLVLICIMSIDIAYA